MRVLSRFISVIILGLLVIAGWYANEVRIAREQTPALVAAALEQYGAELAPAALSSERKAMLLAIEDPKFLTHHGVDLSTPGAGMTTITQGLVKLLYFPQGFKPGIAKIRQTLIAQYALDALTSKEEQLLLFLNMTYLGNEDRKSVHGFANAARVYFDKEFAALNDEEFIALAGMLISPNNLKPGTPASDERVQRISAYLNGEIHPASLLDVEYTGKQQGSVAEETLIMFLRLITGAEPA
ncbi:MAG: transglycosylase domain-containing protein [Thiolinea sp.]